MADTLPPLKRWNPAGAPTTGCVHIVRGMAEHHRERYERLAGHLTADGYVVWPHDYRGHGMNAGVGRGTSRMGTGGVRL